ncbi:MAG: right-handed parallel beta-helix repeat-containing protein [Gammaproteobacteria bacterium]|nr:right-handed parallel beta-helix repeat-containing protein [Gammaproteobacteria bacterium]
MTRRLAIVLVLFLSACVGPNTDQAASNSTGSPNPTPGTSNPVPPPVNPPPQSTPTPVPTPTPPSAAVGVFEGYGNQAIGGSGQVEVLVTNLNDSGPGSLRAAAAAGNRVIKFAVAGTINLQTILYLSGPNVTLDGFSAPSPGITLSGNSLQIGGNPNGPDAKGSNIIVQGIRIRNSSDKSILVSYNAHDVVVDHCSFARALDEEIALTEGSYNVTVSWSIIADNQGPGGVLLSFDTAHVSMHHNIFYGNKDRNPILTGTYIRNYSSGPPHSDPLADVRYNLVWNYGIGTYVVSSDAVVASGNVVANLYKNDASTNPSDVVVRAAYGLAQQADAYIAGNIAVHDARGCAYSYNDVLPCFKFNTVNSMSNVAEYAVPPVTGPAITNHQGLLDTWAAVKAGAGPSMFPDDAEDASVRNAITIPATSVFTQPWNF